jgi:hypothetical protein
VGAILNGLQRGRGGYNRAAGGAVRGGGGGWGEGWGVGGVGGGLLIGLRKVYTEYKCLSS